MKKIVSLFFFLVMVACREQNNERNDIYCPKFFSINFDKTFMVNCSEGKNGFNGHFITKNRDTIFYNFGYHLSNLAEIEPKVIYYPNSKADLNIENSGVIVTNELDYDIDEFRKQNVFYDVIDSFKAKIVIPRKSGTGLVGVFFDSLGINKIDEKYSFNLYTENLSKKDEDALLKAIKSIKFKRPIIPSSQIGVP